MLYTHAIRTSTENCEGAVNQSTDQICDSITEFKDDFNQKFDDFRANPPVQKVEKTIRIARESWQWYLTLGFTIFSTLLFFAMIFWQEGRIEQCRISDIKYHYILMNGGVGTVGLDSIESWFNDTKKVKQIEAEVRAYEERVQETVRALDQKHRLEEKINELNTQSQNSKKMTATNTNKTLSTIAAHRIEDLFDDFCIYIAKRYGASYDDAILDWNCVGATFRYFGRNIHIQLKVWEYSNGHNNLPDDIITVSDFVTGSGNAQDKNEFFALCQFIFELGSHYGFKYLAVKTPPVIFTKEVAVPNTLIPCMKLA